MTLVARWGVFSSSCLEQLLARGGPHCGGPVGRLARHDAGAGGEQIWLSCCSCSARLGGALPTSRSAAALLSHLTRRPRHGAGAGRDRGNRPRLEAARIDGIAPRDSERSTSIAAVMLPPLQRVRRAERWL
jgi:hypothetical protein